MKHSRVCSVVCVFLLCSLLLTACHSAETTVSSGSDSSSSTIASAAPSEPDISALEEAGQGPSQAPASAFPPEEKAPQEEAFGQSLEPASEPEPESKPEPKPEPEPEPEAEPEPEFTRSSVKNTKLYILMYHHFVEGDGTGCNDWTITTDRFREDLQWLADHGYTTLLPSQLAQGGPLPEKAVLITLDDGYSSNYELAFPILKEFNAKAVISIIVGWIDSGKSGFLTWDMCREMADSGLVEFGSHTYDSHEENPRGIKRISGESKEEYEARIFSDLQASIDLIQSNLGTQVLFFAYPHGQTESWASSFLKEHFAITVTTKHGPADISGGLYDLPRHNITVTHPASEYLPA